MTIEETQRAVLAVVERASRLATRDGQAFIRVTYDADRDEIAFGTVPAQYVKVSYDQG